MLFKKIASIFLAATMMLSMFALTVSAESVQNTEIFKVEVEAVSAASTVSSNPVIFNNGEEITVNVFASQNTGFTMLRMIIDFDENSLEVVNGKFSSTGIYSDAKLSLGEGMFEFSSFTDFNVKTATGLLATITFVAKEDVCFTEDEFNASEIIKVYPYENNNGFCVNADFEELPLVSEVVPFAVHEISSGVVTNPTCLDEGYTTYHCELCDKDIVGNITEPAGHVPAEKPVVENYVDPTCTVEGSYDNVIYCSVCSAELSRTAMVVEPLGHDLVPHDSKAPTCTEIGWGTYNSCSRCDYTTYVEKAALGHTYGESTVVEPEYDAEGYTTHTCTVCGHEEKYDIVPALTYILGDTNGDEVVDSEDAIHLLYYTLLPESISVNQKCDFDGNGDVNSDDAIYLLYYTLLPDQYPLNK